MEMTPDWMRQTVDFLVDGGWRLDARQRDERFVGDQLAVVQERSTVSRGCEECFVLEVLEYPDGRVRYLMEVVAFHGLTMRPYPLDSWRHKPGQVEFKFQVDPESSMGLAFTLELSPPSPS